MLLIFMLFTEPYMVWISFLISNPIFNGGWRGVKPTCYLQDHEVWSGSSKSRWPQKQGKYVKKLCRHHPKAWHPFCYLWVLGCESLRRNNYVTDKTGDVQNKKLFILISAEECLRYWNRQFLEASSSLNLEQFILWKNSEKDEEVSKISYFRGFHC